MNYGHRRGKRHLDLTKIAFRFSGRPKRGNSESYGGKNVRARLKPFLLNWPEPVLLGQPERTNEKQATITSLTTRTTS